VARSATAKAIYSNRNVRIDPGHALGGVKPKKMPTKAENNRRTRRPVNLLASRYTS
jgi:hypothetical protein